MRKTPEMRALEAERGREIREIISDAFERGGNLDNAAQIVGVDPSTLSRWISRRLKGKLRSRVEWLREGACAP